MSEGAAIRVELPFFAGDLEELVRRVLRREIDPSHLSVAAVTSQLAANVAGAATLDLDLAGTALALSAHLLSHVSSSLLMAPGREDEADLAAPAAAIDRDLLAQAADRFREREGLEVFVAPPRVDLVERPVQPRNPSVLARLWSEMYQRRPMAPVRVSVPAFVRLESAVSSLIRQLKAGGGVRLGRLLRGSSRGDAVVHFLAVLELVRRRQARAHQAGPFGEITLEYAQDGSDAASRAG
ncbi:MAG TPA: hypothetical protein VKX16_18760 [Chloroflexota bacterium]|nr:hypothetical protein [Chloroflexota bacterium]